MSKSSTDFVNLWDSQSKVAKEKHTSKGMVIVVHCECPPSDRGVRCRGKHGTCGCPYSICAIHARMEALLRRRWGALLVGGNQGTAVGDLYPKMFSSINLSRGET